MKRIFKYSFTRILPVFMAVCLFLCLAGTGASAQAVNLGDIITLGAELSAAEQILGWEDIVSISVSSGKKGDFVLGLRSDGTVCAAGLDDKGQCQVQDWKNVIKIAAGDSIAMGLRSDGQVYCSGYGDKAAPDTSDWENVEDIAVGSEFVLGIDSEGRQLYSGLDEFNIDIWFSADRDNKVWPDKEDEMRFWSELKAVRAAGENILGMDSSGEIRSFGFGQAAELPKLSDISDFELSLCNGAALDMGGHACIWGDDSFGQCRLPGDGVYSSLSLGGAHSLFLLPDGTAAAFGCNDCGQCQVGDWVNLVDVEAGSRCSFGITEDGRVLMCGIIG